MDRFLLAIGGFVGFGGSFLSALSVAGDDISSALLRGSIGMIAGVVLIKILIFMAHAVFRDARREKMKNSTPSGDHEEETPEDEKAAHAAASDRKAARKA
jgi:tetrahydromethanopterin S-methyltransferase subunit E